MNDVDLHLLYLSLAMAVIAEYARHEVRLPLVLDEPFSHLEERRQSHVAGVLDEFARQGHQLLVFTSSEAGISRLKTLGATCHDLRQIALTPGTIDVRPAEVSILNRGTRNTAPLTQRPHSPGSVSAPIRQATSS